MTTDGRPILEVRDLRTYFHTRDGVVKAVDGVSFEVRRGEILGIVGESGCGKSVTSLSLMRLVPQPGRIEEGSSVTFDGRDILKMSSKELEGLRGEHVSMIFQQPTSALNPVTRIGVQISEVFEIHRGLSREEGLERAREMLATVGIPDVDRRVDSYPHEFSGGMAQRVMIAMALACEPDLLIADEPTTALDVTIQAQILDLMRNLQKNLNTATILITHDLGIVAEMADRIAVMYAGQIVEEADAITLFEEPKHPYTQGLIGSVPVLGTVKDLLDTIPGTVPDLIDLPVGCRFADRCKARVEHQLTICTEIEPELFQVGEGHRARCWLYSEDRR
jgi:oligopeptide/dipeptide ABC transporter ATP-binding protein